MTDVQKLAEEKYPYSKWDEDRVVEAERFSFIAGFKHRDEMERWIPVEQGTPHDGKYLCMCERTEECGTVSKYQKVVTNKMNHWMISLMDGEKVTHWQPLPSPPKSNDDGK